MQVFSPLPRYASLLPHLASCPTLSAALPRFSSRISVYCHQPDKRDNLTEFGSGTVTYALEKLCVDFGVAQVNVPHSCQRLFSLFGGR